MAYQYDDAFTAYSSEQIIDLTAPSFAEPEQREAVFDGWGLYSDNAAPIADGMVSSATALDERSRNLFWLDASAVPDDQAFIPYSWGPTSSDSDGSSMSSAAVTPSLKRKRSALDDNAGSGDVATREEGLRPSKIARAGPAPNATAASTSGFETPVDREPLVVGWVSDSVNDADFELELGLDLAPDLHSVPDFGVPGNLPATDLPAPDDLPTPAFIPEFLPFADFVFAPGLSTFDTLAAVTSPQAAAAAEEAGEVCVHEEPPVRTPEDPDAEDCTVPSIPSANERDEQSLDAVSPSAQPSAPTPEPEIELVQPAPRPLQWVIKNPGNHMGLEQDRRIGQTDFWLADAPAEHTQYRYFRRSQPCDVPGCSVRFEPGSVGNFAFHDARTRTQGHKRLRYRCPRPGCNKTYGRADSMKVHLTTKQVCGDFVVGVLQPIYGEEAVPNIADLTEWQVLPYFAIMRS
ncbi:hypothetical protein FOMPIDRAFT_91455 [Fomitopsis schrenkii]|uniref:Uncharacterized protein n=1 Tax=Fomitopsis schrenkii TaxID=2126942 RepID=S8DKR9_FOMSC|nr:hypothetical protein FOMPIDRAFT_91455 [Fomitopsis schrenkii]